MKSGSKSTTKATRSPTFLAGRFATEFASTSQTVPKLGAGEYLIVAKDADLVRAKYPNITVLGDFDGSLSDRDDNIRLRDAGNNIVDEVHYYDGGAWDSYADGGGSSLELSDPKADNSKAEVWAASFEGDDSEWTEHRFRGIAEQDVAGGRAQFNEFIFGLLDAGEFLIDDVQVIENPSAGDGGVPLIQNGTFENDPIGDEAAAWRIIGYHSGTVIVDPTDPNNKVLHVVADRCATTYQ